MPIYPPGFASIGDFLKIFVWQNAPPSLGKSGFRSSTIYMSAALLNWLPLQPS
jgi:hypothetical protein